MGDWVQVKSTVSSPKYGWDDITRNSIGIVHSLEEDGDMGIGFCFRNKPFCCSVTDVEKVPPFEVGQEIRMKPSVTQPRLGWSSESPATIGKIARIDMDGALNVSMISLTTYILLRNTQIEAKAFLWTAIFFSVWVWASKEDPTAGFILSFRMPTCIALGLPFQQSNIFTYKSCVMFL